MLRLNLLVDSPGSGSWNMALDEALLRRAEAEGATTLRFYRWSEPTLSLGYFQAHAQRREHAASLGCPLVRRASGGGALLHDRELTYSFATPVGDRLAGDVEQLYYAFHETLQIALGRWQVAAALHRASPAPAGGSSPRAFLCFQRHTPGDLLLQGAKILGSAQRRRRGAVLQHGGILLARSASAPELPGIAELAGVTLDDRQLIDAWLSLLTERLGAHCEPWSLDSATERMARQIEREKFASESWTLRR